NETAAADGVNATAFRLVVFVHDFSQLLPAQNEQNLRLRGLPFGFLRGADADSSGFAIRGRGERYRFQSATIHANPAKKGSREAGLDAQTGNQGIEGWDGVGTSIYLELQRMCDFKGHRGAT
ncbi:MAG TPA: hypothetical protein VHA06_03915, partial [Candidatus Angelobacter sp.]|nr:hypothetical protein [Candidatus Angelobacter sp.]